MPRLPRLFTALRRFARARDGATAIEFGIIAIPMLILVFGTLELGMVLLVASTLDTATEFASRDVRTGVFQNSGAVTANDFKAKVCRNMTWLSANCAGRMTVEAQTFATFTTASANTSESASTFDNAAKRCWSVGNPGDIVLVRTYYAWPLFTPLLDKALANRNGDTRMMSSARVFRNEPYNTNEKLGAQCAK